MADERGLKRICITPEHVQPDEVDLIERLLDDGWDVIHLRHPGISEPDMRRLIESIPSRWHGHLRLHDHFGLVGDYQLGGLHLNGRNPELPAGYNGAMSRSCHTIAEVEEATGFDYVTISPVFDSISKQGYRAAFSHKDLKALNETAATDVIALGGVTPDRIDIVEQLGFSGYAVLGAIKLFI
ncbi:MAG: thiamine phosphate synthase [Bacteroides sp.]|nr:thiamine phosphate synthase [Bacteroides sp.]MCM1414166.1 thiamine phosphate synthase [Bacteroides sp.]MCM1471284.1 thiamine phosphate synthase [Bacteroides sp.]